MTHPDEKYRFHYPEITLLSTADWQDYDLLDSGNGLKLERYGEYLFVRPEPQAMWRPALKESTWKSAHAIFQPSSEESGGHWHFHIPVEPGWMMRYQRIVFQARTTAGRHLGVFPEQAANWSWITAQINSSGRPVQVLNLFGYTGLATLAAALAGAKVTHVDASKKAVSWARMNQELSGLADRPIRWIVDDALKFVEREARRGVRYDGIILDPPKFGRGPKGEVWEFFDLFPRLMTALRGVLSIQPAFVVITAYAIRASALSIHYSLDEMMSGFPGLISSGELTLEESSAGRNISMAIFARWSAGS